MSHNTRSIYNYCIEKGRIKEDIEFSTFSTVIKEFHKAISTEIQVGHKFNIGELGIISIISDKRKGRTIDWGRSNKYKENLIKNGEIPFNKETAPEGKQWFVYYEGGDYYKWKWFKGKTKYLKNVICYMFKPSTKNRRTIGKVVKTNPLAVQKYGSYRKSNIL